MLLDFARGDFKEFLRVLTLPLRVPERSLGRDHENRVLTGSMQQLHSEVYSFAIQAGGIGWKARIVEQADNVTELLAACVNEQSWLDCYAQAYAQTVLSDNLLGNLYGAGQINANHAGWFLLSFHKLHTRHTAVCLSSPRIFRPESNSLAKALSPAGQVSRLALRNVRPVLSSS